VSPLNRPEFPPGRWKRTLAIGSLVLTVLVAGNTDAAIGMAMALLAPVVIVAVIGQLILWFAEAHR
jgi:hypothetical protein